VEGDIKACFDSFDHHVLIEILKRRIADENFLALIWKFLRAGYMEQWVYHKTYSGTPQGSGMSPTLANIYLNELDVFVEQYKAKFGKGKSHQNLEYAEQPVKYSTSAEEREKLGLHANEERNWQKSRKGSQGAFKTPSKLQCDNEYKSIQYCAMQMTF
jgi:retron-type reverse transcriptase